MMKAERHARILALLSECDELPLGEMARRLGRVSEVTVRRDVAELAAERKLERRRGGASRLGVRGGESLSPALAVPSELESVDALVLPPIEGRGAETLRMLARRRQIPFLAESSAQDFGAYLGPDNFAVGRDLGNRAGRALSGQLTSASILVISIEHLPNTRARCEGFERGFAETFGGQVQHRRIDSRGSYRVALESALDAFDVHPETNIVFGVNDHAILAGLEAAERRGNKVRGYCVGGEGGPLFDALAAQGALQACAALFPEVVGIRAVDVIAEVFAGTPMPNLVSTPHAVLTSENLGEFYEKTDEGWSLRPQALHDLVAPRATASPPKAGSRPRSIGFAPHYPAHDWYRGMERAMRQRCAQYGFELRVAPPQAGIARELDRLRHLIARSAIAGLPPGETVLVSAGVMALPLAERLASRPDLTVVTNSFDVLKLLADKGGPKVILTSGEYQARDRCLVGPSLGALFETMRIDKALLSIDGVSARFGASCADERLALAARRFINASREVIVLADHSLIGIETNHRVAPAGQVTELITDSGSLPADRMACAAAGMRVTLADLDPLDRRERAGAQPRNEPAPQKARRSGSGHFSREPSFKGA